MKIKILSILLLALVPVKNFAQKNIFIKGELTDRLVFEDTNLVFKITIKNLSSDTIQIPDSNLRVMRRGYSEDKVGYELKALEYTKERLCDYFADGPFNPDKRILYPGQTEFINAFFPRGCVRRKTKYKIVLYLNVKMLNSDKNKTKVIELATNEIYFELK